MSQQKHFLSQKLSTIMSLKLNGSMSHKNDFNNITAKIDFF